MASERQNPNRLPRVSAEVFGLHHRSHCGSVTASPVALRKTDAYPPSWSTDSPTCLANRSLRRPVLSRGL